MSRNVKIFTAVGLGLIFILISLDWFQGNDEVDITDQVIIEEKPAPALAEPNPQPEKSEERAVSEESKVPSPPPPSTGNTAVIIGALNSCFSYSFPLPENSTNMKADEFLSVLSVLGQIMIRHQEMNMKEIELDDGSRRRIILERGFEDSGSGVNSGNAEDLSTNSDEEAPMGSSAVLTYLKLLPDGSTEEIPLEDEQKLTPSPNLIASLESEGRLVSEEKEERLYYPLGDEVSFHLKDEALVHLNISRLEKTFICDGLLGENPQCRCSDSIIQNQ